MTTREWIGETPWRKLAEIAKRVVRAARAEHGKPNDANMIYADTRDFEDEFEYPLRLLIAQTELKIIMEHAHRELPGLKQEAFDKQEEVNKLCFELARRERPDGD